MICEKCGDIILTLEVDVFDHEGADHWVNFSINEVPDNVVYIDLPTNWTGCEQSEEEQMESIRCPHCHQFPFRHKEVDTYAFTRCVMFKFSPGDAT